MAVLDIQETTAEDAEEEILDKLPVNVSYTLGTGNYANVISFIHI